ncbi:MAG TPA: hypothetical protein VLK36_04530 [Gaiellaceae bacterium]|nr:hypothetical protein [Gaiellaceae bacterium]
MQLQLEAIAVLTSGAGYLMVSSGLHKGLLRWSRAGRICPSCGRELDARVCRFCSAR